MKYNCILFPNRGAIKLEVNRKKITVLLNMKNLFNTQRVKEVEIRDPEQVINEFKDIFTDDIKYLKGTTKFTHSINLKENKPIFTRQYTIPFSVLDKLKQKINEFCQANIIRPSTSAWNSPLLVIHKENGDIRMVRKINSITEDEDYPLPF